MIGLARSSYYYKARDKDCDKAKQEQRIVARIMDIKAEFSSYGRPRITKALQREGLRVNHKRVRRIMLEKGLLCKVKRRFMRTTNSEHGLPIYPNLIKDTEVTGLDRVWVADITYVGIEYGFVFLACILDVYSRKVIGHGLSQRIDTELTLAALRMAIMKRKPAGNTIHHSDQGVQYASADYVKELKGNNFLISMSRRGNPYDNATMESFYKTLKYEEVYLCGYRTVADVVARVPYFIEEVYNKKRLHSSIGYVPPDEFEASIKAGQREVVYV